MSKKKKQKKANDTGKRVLDVLLSVALVAGVCCGGVYVAAKSIPIEQTPLSPTTEIELPTEPVTEPTGPVFDSADVENSVVFNSPLILVNNDYPCLSGEDGLVSLYEKKLEADSHSFSVKDDTVQVQAEMADALIAMLNDFYDATYDDNIIVLSGYRSKEHQQELYDEDLETTGLDYSERVSKPGYSEHQTGWGVDLSLYDGSDYDGTGIYEWINEHCAEYGIILRYPENKTEITNIQYEPWHYRYVGKPHAAYIMQNDLCLEEYIDLLKEYPYEGEHLLFTDTDGKAYEIYYCQEDAGYDTTSVPVLSGAEYTVYGNNIDGFIVAVETGEQAVPEIAATEPDADAGEESGEDSSVEDPGEDSSAEDSGEDSDEDPSAEDPGEDAGADAE